MRNLIFILVLICMQGAIAELQSRDYEGFTLWLDCEDKLARMAYYSLGQDKADNKKPRGYKLDDDYESCRQKSNDYYQTTLNDKGSKEQYHVGHIVNANHMDSTKQSIADSMYMGNMFPQVGKFNGSGGAWYYTEILSECLRDFTELEILTGLVMGEDESNDHFIESHGVRTPDTTWKIIYRKDTNSVQIFIMPNHKDSIDDNMADYVKSFDELLELVSVYPEIHQFLNILNTKSVDLNLWEVKKAGNSNLKCGTDWITSIK